MKKRNEVIYTIVAVLFVFFLLFPREEVYDLNLFYMDTMIDIKVYSRSEKKATEALDEVVSIYKTYHDLADRFEAHHGLTNIYYINNNEEDVESLKLDPKLYELLKYGISWHEKSGGIKNINLGNVIDVWAKYRDSGEGIPTLEELQNSGSTDINDIVLLPNNYILNNKPNIDLGSIAKGYATEQAGQYLKKKGLTKFLINAGGNVLVGDHYKGEKYRIGLQDPMNANGILEVVKGTNIAVVTSGGYERYYEYDGQRYSHIIDPATLFPANHFESVTVVTDDSALGDALSLILFVMDLKTGQDFIKDYSNVEVLWYGKDGTITKSDGFKKYE